MIYVCQMCPGGHAGSDTRAGFVEHMQLWHGVRITVDDIMYLEGLTPEAERTRQRSQRMIQAWKCRRERASLEAFAG